MDLGSKKEVVLTLTNVVITNRGIMVNQQQLPHLASGPKMAEQLTLPTTAGPVMKDSTLDSNCWSTFIGTLLTGKLVTFGRQSRHGPLHHSTTLLESQTRGTDIFARL